MGNPLFCVINIIASLDVLVLVSVTCEGQIQEFKKGWGVQWNFLQKKGGGGYSGQYLILLAGTYFG